MSLEDEKRVSALAALKLQMIADDSAKEAGTKPAFEVGVDNNSGLLLIEPDKNLSDKEQRAAIVNALRIALLGEEQ